MRDKQQTNKQTLKIELLSQWKLEAESFAIQYVAMRNRASLIYYNPPQSLNSPFTRCISQDGGWQAVYRCGLRWYQESLAPHCLLPGQLALTLAQSSISQVDLCAVLRCICALRATVFLRVDGQSRQPVISHYHALLAPPSPPISFPLILLLLLG